MLPGLLESGTVVLPGAKVPGVPESGVVVLPGIGVILLVEPESGVVVLLGTGVKLPGVPDSGVVVLPGAGAGVILLVEPESGLVVLPGAGVVSGVDPGVVVLPGVGFVSEGVGPGVVVVSGAGVNVPDGRDSGLLGLPGVVLSGVGLVVPLLGAPVLTAVPPGQREFSGKFSHRTFMPSGDILISVGELVDELLDWAMEDLLDWAAATLALSAKVRAVPIRLRVFPFILN